MCISVIISVIRPNSEIVGPGSCYANIAESADELVIQVNIDVCSILAAWQISYRANINVHLIITQGKRVFRIFESNSNGGLIHRVNVMVKRLFRRQIIYIIPARNAVGFTIVLRNLTSIEFVYP